MLEHLKHTDAAVHGILKQELNRQRATLGMIPSENFISEAVMEAAGSWLNNKYSEGYPGKRYYGGNEHIDELERLAIQRAKDAFGAEHANVQPYSGSPANLAAYLAIMQTGDTFLGMSLAHGGHLTHGHTVSATGKIFNAVHYGVRADTELIDYEQVRSLALEHKPKVIVCGATAYPRLIDYAAFAEIAHEVGAVLLADISHVAGLVVGQAHPSPFPHADMVMTTTHKTLRGPRGALLLTKQAHAQAIDKSIFPGLQGGPHNHITAAIAVALHEAMQPEFKTYAKKVIANAQVLAQELQANGIRLITGGTDTHLLLGDVTSTGLTGAQAETVLDSVGVVCNKNMIPFDPRKPMDPSGVRLGTPGLTTRGMKEEEMKLIGSMLGEVLRAPKDEQVLARAKGVVKELTKKFPLYSDIVVS
ncbi:MAG: serine hydroxymethyltransferase [Patescibacteria group bacterium]